MISPIRTAEVSLTVAVTRPGARAVLQNTKRASGHFSFRSRQSVASTVELNMGYAGRGASIGRYRIPLQRPELKREDDPLFWDEHHAALAKATAEAEARKPENWPQSRQLAILFIERSAIALDCIAHMSGTGVRPSQSDFLWLREQGYAVRQLGQRYHRLMPQGVRLAREVVSIVAKRLGLHHIVYRFDSWNGHAARCSCGWTATSDNRQNRNWKAPLQSAASKHICDPKDWLRKQAAAGKIMDTISFIGARDTPG